MRRLTVGLALAVALCAFSGLVWADGPEEIAGMNGAYFAADGPQAVVFVPGARYDRTSWYPLARRLQAVGVASVALSSGIAIEDAVALLKSRGFRKVALLGASLGGADVSSEAQSGLDAAVNKIALLAPFSCAPLMDSGVAKLFLVAEEDGVVDSGDVRACHDASAGPKLFTGFAGSEHAQELFDGAHREALFAAIMEFLTAEE